MARPVLIPKFHNSLHELSRSYCQCVCATRPFPCDYSRVKRGQLEWMITIKDGVEQWQDFIPAFTLIPETFAHHGCKLVDGKLKFS